MKVVVAVVGKPRDAALAALIRDYETRACRYWPLHIVEVRGESAKGVSVEQVRERESARLLAAIATAATVVVCDALGVGQTSEAFSAWLQQERERARDVAFVIGGAFGLAPSVRTRAQRTLALAPWTLPHELARLVLAEQLYRAGTIVRGEPYHK